MLNVIICYVVQEFHKHQTLNTVQCLLHISSEVKKIEVKVYRRRRRRRIYAPNLHTKFPIKNHVMDGYQKGHMAIQAGGLKNR